MASPLSVFTAFQTVQGPSYIRGVKDIVNEAAKQNYACLNRMLRGRDPSEIMQGGNVIRDVIFFDEENTFQFHQPGETFTWQNPQTLDNWEIPWRFSIDHMSWTDAEIELNFPEGMSREAQQSKYKELKYHKEQRLWTSLLNGMADSLWAVPSNSTMEDNDGTTPYSIPAFVNSGADTGNEDGMATGANTVVQNDGLHNGFTTLQNINSGTETRWRCQQVGYDYGDYLDADGDGDGIIHAFDDMYYRVRFDRPETAQQYFEQDSLYRQAIVTNRKGMNIYQDALRDHNDRFAAGMQDPAYLNPMFGGIPLVYEALLDTAALYYDSADAYVAWDASTLASGYESTREVAGPRFYWLNFNYLKIIYHARRYFYKKAPMTHPNQPDTTVQIVNCWYNTVCRSRRRQGIVAPID